MSLRRKLAIIALVYVIEGFPMGVWLDLFPVYLRREDVSLTALGFLNVFSFAWVFKFLWSPLVDRFGERRQWIAASMIVMALCCVGIARADPAHLGVFLLGCIGVYCAASATQDVAIDAYSIGLVDRGEEGPFNSMKAAAYRIGMLAAGGGLLLAPRWIGWPGTFAAAAVLSIAFAVSIRLAPQVHVPLESRRATIEPLRRWLSQGSVLPVFFFVLLYRIGDRAMGPMVKPFWVDWGFANEEIALVNTTLGIVATILDSACGYAAFSLMPPGTGVLSIEYKVNMLAPARGERFVARGWVKRAGRTVTVTHGDTLAIDGNGEKVVATMLATMMTIRDREGVVD